MSTHIMIDLAIDAAKKAGKLALKRNKVLPKVNFKADYSPVTEADLAAEKLIRYIVGKKFPDHGIIGEEFPETNPGAKYKWIIDPIDGTADYIRQIPFWSTMIAVLENNKPIIGVIYFPALKELYTAEKDKGAFLNGKKILVSKIKNIKRSYITMGSFNKFEQVGRQKGIFELAKIVQSRKNFGSYCNALVFQGKSDANLNAQGGIYDFAAPSLITTEAGGSYSDFDGNKSIENGTLLISNGAFHNQVLKVLNEK